MYHKIMEILVLLMDEFGTQTWKPEQVDQFNEHLIQHGYTEQEINSAFYWLYNRFGWDNGAPLSKVVLNLPQEDSSRVLNPIEQRFVSPEAFGYLLQLRYMHLLTAREMEEVIERSQLLDFQRASVDEIKVVVQSLLFDEGAAPIGFAKPSSYTGRGETCH
jgi:uncharacterized protein Smg (DUF494 family)